MNRIGMRDAILGLMAKCAENGCSLPRSII